MAIDTKAKRFSILNFGSAEGGAELLIDPDGTIGSGDQYHLLDLYSGITLDAPGGTVLISQARSVARFVFGRVFGRVN